MDPKVLYVQESSETMRILVGTWLKDIKNGIMSLKNLEVALQGSNINEEHYTSIKESTLQLREALEKVMSFL